MTYSRVELQKIAETHRALRDAQHELSRARSDAARSETAICRHVESLVKLTGEQDQALALERAALIGESFSAGQDRPRPQGVPVNG